jgi:Family of unknown function (DUF6308)
MHASPSQTGDAASAGTSATLRIARLDGGTLVLEAASLARAFFLSAGFDQFDRGAAVTDPDRVEMADIGLLNQVMRARTARADWESLLGAPLRFLAAIPHDLDLIRSSDSDWERAAGRRLVEDVFESLVGSRRGLAVVTKLLHLKRPRLFPILDRLVVEMLGSSIPAAGQPSARAARASELVMHLRVQGRRNELALRRAQELLRQEEIDRALVRILDSVLWSSHPAARGKSVSTRTIECRVGGVLE